MSRRTGNATFPLDLLKKAERSIRRAYTALGGARDLLSDASDDRWTALGMPDRLRIDPDKLSRIRASLQEVLAGVNTTIETGGCGATSESARRRASAGGFK